MTVSSKFNIKQKVFWLENNKVRKAVVKSIQFPLVQMLKNQQVLHGEFMYFVSDNTKSSVINWNGGGLRESQVFASKAELLKSL